MSALVLDSSVIFDLERGRLIPAAFRLDATFIVPDLLLGTELGDDPIAGEMLELGLMIVEFEPDELERTQALGRKYPKLSRVDCSTLVTASVGGRGDRLLTGDGALRDAARTEKAPCSGLLWLLEQLHSTGVVGPVELFDGLSLIKGHTRTRLPATHVDAFLHKLERSMKRDCEPVTAKTNLRITERRQDSSSDALYVAAVELVRAEAISMEPESSRLHEPIVADVNSVHPKKRS